MKKIIHYVSNKKFLEALIAYRAIVAEARASKAPDPKMPTYIAECLMQIADKLSNRPNFIGYPMKEDMINDGIENCVRGILVFDPARSSNPFAFFTQVIKNAFIRRIKAEKRQLYLKFKSSQNQHLVAALHDNAFLPEDSDIVNQYILEYETSIAEKKIEEKARNDKK